MPITISCAICGKFFKRKVHNNIYCGDSCRKAAKKKPLPKILECKHCKNTFSPKSLGIVFCSYSCREKYKKSREGRGDHLKDKLTHYFLSNPCVDCGECDIRVLEFDHRLPKYKKDNISVMLKRRVSWRELSNEIRKCDVVCVKCHRIRSFNRMRRCWRLEAWKEHQGV